MKKFSVTYTNLNKECYLNGDITKIIFADSKGEARQLCEDLYNDQNGHFRIKKLTKIGEI